MTTAELYRPTSQVASTGALGPDIRILFVSSDRRLVSAGDTEETLAHVRAMRELAALSRDPHSLGRDLEDEINRNAWGISEV